MNKSSKAKTTHSHEEGPIFDCDFRQVRKAFPHFWEHTVGSGHAPLALRADWQAQMLRCHHELGFQHVRFHAMLSDEMGTLLCEENQLLYSFFNADQIIDFLLSIGMRPFVELSFMPEALASGSTTVFSYRANVTPPKDYDQWATLIQKLLAHWVSRYGAAEVAPGFSRSGTNRICRPSGREGRTVISGFTVARLLRSRAWMIDSRWVARQPRTINGFPSFSLSAGRTPCRSISSAPITIRPMPSERRERTQSPT